MIADSDAPPTQLKPVAKHDIVHGEDVRQTTMAIVSDAPAAQRKNLISLGRLFRNQLDDGRVNFKYCRLMAGTPAARGNS
jgi:hypothetical protein